MAQKKEVIEHKMCVLIFSTTFVLNISPSKENSVRHYQHCIVYRSSCKVLLTITRY